MQLFGDEGTQASLIRPTSTLQCLLKAVVQLDDILEVCFHQAQVFGAARCLGEFAVVCSGSVKGYGCQCQGSCSRKGEG